MRNVKLIGLTVAFLALPASASAQGVPYMGGGIGFFGGVALPSGDFGDDEGDDAGAATTGFMIGADSYLPLGTTAFGWVTSVSLNTFGVDTDDADNVDLGRYWLIPVVTGVSFPISMGPTMTLAPMAQIGLNVAYGPNGEVNDDDFSTSTSFSLAFSAGANLTFTETLGATVRYVNGGAPEREIEQGEFEGERDNPMSWLQLGVVYKFR